jgi:adenine phosphoribosyltransferase
MTMTAQNIDPKLVEEIKASIRDIPDFPKPGIIFKDITTLLSNPEVFNKVTKAFVDRFKDERIDFVAVPESRGFIFGAPVANALNAGLTLIRKPGKLPAKSINVSYQLEYGSDTLCIHEDAFSTKKNPRVIIIDDLLATGGSCKASAELVNKAGAELVAAAFVIELDFLEGRKQIDTEVFSLIHY